MTKEECFEFFGISDLMELPQAVSRLLALPLNERNRQYRELITLNEHDMSRDWFQLLFEQELAQRKQKGISVKDIPAGLVVKRDKDGSYRLLDNRDNLEEASQKNLELRREQRMEHMERKRRELVILTNYYCGSQTDDNELLSYCEMVRPELVAWCRKRYLLSRANGDDLYSQAVARFLESVSRPSATMTCITGNLKLFIKKVYASHKAETDISRNVMRVLRSGEEGL